MNRSLTTLISVFMSLWLTQTSASANENISIQDFFTYSEVKSLRLSPTGDYYAAKIKYQKKATLAILERKTLKLLYVFNFGDTKREEVGRFGWLNDERIWLTKVYKSGPLGKERPTGQLYAGNIDGSKKIQLLPEKSRSSRKGSRGPKAFSFIDMLTDESKFTLIQKGNGEFTEVIKLNVYSGHQRKIARSPGPYSSFVTDIHGNLKFAISRNQDSQTNDVYMKEADKWNLIDSRDEQKGDFTPLGFTPDNKQVYIFSGEGKQSGIYLYNPKTKELTLKHLVKGKANITHYVWDDSYTKPELIGYTQEPGYVRTTYFTHSNKVAKTELQLANMFPKQHLRVIDYTKDGNMALVFVYSDKNPGSYYLYNKKKKNLDFVIDIRSKIDRQLMAEKKPILFKARDGLDIHGYLTLPNDKKTDLPLVLLVHGGPYGISDHWRFNVEAQFLANRGYGVLQVNYRGSGGRGKDFVYKHYREMGAEMQDDITDATLWAIKKGIANKEKICIYGGSYGGYAALMAVVKEPDLYKCAIGYAGVYDIAIQTKDSDTARSDYGRRFLKDAWNAYDDDFVKQRSSLFHLDKLKAALLLVHGKDDPRTPYTQYKALTNKLDDMNYPYESLVKPFELHGFGDQDNVYELYEKMETFLAKHIKNK